MPIFWRVLIINGCWILSKAFFCICGEYHMFFFFQFANMVYCFAYIEESLHSWNKPKLIIVYEILGVLLNSVCQNSVEDFCIYVHQWYWLACIFLFCVLSLLLLSGWLWPCRMSLEVFFLLQVFKRVLKG